MRWTHPLDEILGSKARVRVLRRLWVEDGSPLSGREIARRTGLSHTGVQKSLEELDAQDVIAPTADGSGIRYRLNRRSDLVRQLIVPLFEWEESRERRFADYLLEHVPQALSIVMFGSTARGEDKPPSDADVLIVVPDDTDAEAAFDEIAGLDTRLRFGKDVGPVVWTLSTLLERSRSSHPLLRSILRDGRIIAGEPLGSLVALRTDIASI